MSSSRECSDGTFEVLLFNHQVIGRGTGYPMNADVSPSEWSGKCLHYPEYIGRIEANLKHAPTSGAIQSWRHNGATS
jgi:hypothetical protein